MDFRQGSPARRTKRKTPLCSGVLIARVGAQKSFRKFSCGNSPDIARNGACIAQAVIRWRHDGGRSVVARQHECENACCFFRVARVVRAVLHRLVEVVVLKKERMTIDLEVAEVVFFVRIVIGTEAVKRPHAINRPHSELVGQVVDSGCEHNAPARQRSAKAVVERTNLAAVLAFDRLMIVGFDLGMAFWASVVAQAIPLIPPVRAARAGVVFSEPRHGFLRPVVRHPIHSGAGVRDGAVARFCFLLG